ncbi:MAG: type I restriction endonuclease subunit R [Candidatus Eremiobacteraeota bacterium]|nr:type I restriction endonuclease subunit R [Candidatus Eremiobacteraeota bacterium]
MSSYLDEDAVEQYAIDLLKDRDYAYLHGSVIAPGGINEERVTFRDSVLVGRLRSALQRLNPTIPAIALEHALRKVSVHETTDVVLNNQRFHRFFIDGVEVEYSDGAGRMRYDRARLIDFENPDSNDWLAVNQFTIKENASERRPDLLIFVNGLPLAIFEFKSPTGEKATVAGAFRQIETYKVEVPGLLAYTGITVISDGTQARIGSLTAPFERFSVWKRPDGGKSAIELDTLIAEVFHKHIFLDLIRYFTFFEATTPPNKILAAYHQYYAVNKAVAETIRAIDGDRRIGVFWHTQGSGKSLSMAFFAGKIAQEPELANPTLLLVTDRNDLDDQLFEQFFRCAQFLRQTPEHAAERDDLRSKLRVAGGGIVFSTIQKFTTLEGEEHFPQLSDRSNIIVIADEAHRSQYGLEGHIDETTGETKYGFAKHLQDALPNALRIGFTGTPVELTDRNTRALFGDYIDVYDVLRAVEDKATVPIYYEARIAKLALHPEEIPKVDEAFEEITEGQETDERRKHATRWSQIEALVGAERRMKEVAKDLVAHFEQRQASFNFDGKAMFVTMSRRIAVDLYDAILALRPDWGNAEDSKGRIKVVMTGSAADPMEMQPHLRNRPRRKAIEKRFKDASDPLQLVIVRDMWLTGFDVPSLHTIYIDKPMRGHSLMQAIARVNRVFRDKPGGLVVDYIGIATELKNALATYVASGGTGDPIQDERDAVVALQREYEVVRDMFHGFAYLQYLDGPPATKLAGLNEAADFILGVEGLRSRFLEGVLRVLRVFALASTSDLGRALSDEVAFFRGVRATIVKATPPGAQSAEDVDLALQQLVSEAVATQGVVDVLAQAGIKRPDISVFSDDFLAEIKDLPQKNLAQQMLQRLLRQEIKVREKSNAVQARKFSEMLEEAVRRYDNRSIDTVQLIERLIEFAKELRDDPKRAEQLGLTEEEVAFYDALADNESAVEVLGDDALRTIARELVKNLRENITIDWNLRESARAGLQVSVKRLLRRYGYPPDKTDKATNQVLMQASLFGDQWAA